MFGRKRDTAGATIRAYEFGARPVGDMTLAGEQLYRRHQLWNQFVEIERDTRAKYRALVATESTQRVAALHEQLEELRQQIRLHKKSAAYEHVLHGKLRSLVEAMQSALADRSPETVAIVKPRLYFADIVSYDGLRERAKQLRQALGVMRAEAKAESRAKAEQLKAEREQLERERTERVKAAMAAANLYWCNSDDVRASYEVARKRAMREGTELHFHRFDGGGKLSVRYQQGLPVAAAFGTDTRLQIDPIDFSIWESADRAVRRRCWTKARLRIGSNDQRQPVWLTLDCWLDGRPGRHLPMEGTIRTAAVIRRRVGTGFTHRLVLTVEAPLERRDLAVERRGTVGLDVGWRLIADHGLRVAYWSDGKTQGALTLPANMVGLFEKVHDLQSIRGLHFNAAVERLQGYLEEHPGAAWLQEQCRYIAQWRSPGRLIVLLRDWQSDGTDGELLEHLQAWRKKEDHLYSWQANLLDQTAAHRRELYRIFAASLGRYARVAIEEFDLRKVLQKPRPEDGAETPDGHMRTIAAVSVLRSAIENYCRREGVEFVVVPSSGTTRRCHVCQSEQQFDQRAELVHRCTTCGETWDQDYNAAENIRQFADRPAGDTILPSAKISPEAPEARV